MAAAELLATGTNSTPSADVTVAAGATLTVALKGGGVVSSDARVSVQLKDDAGAYQEIGLLTGSAPGAVLSAGTYRFVRVAAISCGVFSG